uniref:Uncharacterized protein n=1 Tax=Myoviridae sp. ctrCp2 TaxID=2825179 RepID=A0A8S5NYR2_9CAUD|nr:MAG TPA: hypothetical protein [Myoviridae sp. ctrCp2]
MSGKPHSQNQGVRLTRQGLFLYYVSSIFFYIISFPLLFFRGFLRRKPLIKQSFLRENPYYLRENPKTYIFINTDICLLKSKKSALMTFYALFWGRNMVFWGQNLSLF